MNPLLAIRRAVVLAVVGCLLHAPTAVQACAACFGRSDSRLADGMNMGIFTLLAVVLSVLVGIAAFFVYIIRRAARMEALGRTTSPEAPSSPSASPQSSH